MAETKEPTLDQMRSAHVCLSGMLEGFRQALKVGGPNARAHVGDLVAMIEAFRIGDTSPGKRDVEGPFYPRGVQ